MLPDGTIKVDRLWKRFRADSKEPLLREELARVRASLRRRDDDRVRWALRDITFDAAPGESIGLVGTNGSGKSTLLKILTKVMYPYAGSVEVHGRIGALIELQAGMHPDLSGAENVYLYGSLLGLSRHDLARRFDEMIAFSELEEALNRPLKFYSTGMKMRLGFTVAAFLEPDVLLVDEVLAVGDSAFQAKCLDKLRSLLVQGTTLVLVAHDLLSIEAMCTRGIWLDNGIVRTDAEVRTALRDYRQAIEERAELLPHEGPITLTAARVDDGTTSGTPRTSEKLRVTVDLHADVACAGTAYLGVSEGQATPVFTLRRQVRLDEGDTTLDCTIESLPLARGRFYAWLSVLADDGSVLMPWQPLTAFEVAGPDLHGPPAGVMRLAPVYVDSDWSAGS